MSIEYNAGRDWSDYLPLSAVRVAPGEYDIKTCNGLTLWRMGGASLADWICASVNGYDAAVNALKIADQDVEISRRLRELLKAGFIIGHSHGPSADYQVQLKFRSLTESSHAHTLIEALVNPGCRESFIKQGVLAPFSNSTNQSPAEIKREPGTTGKDQEFIAIETRRVRARQQGWTGNNDYLCLSCRAEGKSIDESTYLDWPAKYDNGMPYCTKHAGGS
jgi:hypothetical protein